MSDRFGRGPAEVQEIGKGALCPVHRDLKFPGQHVNAPDMVRVLVRDKQGFDITGIDSRPFHPQEALFCAQPSIDEQ
jgi:hypothetical protein